MGAAFLRSSMMVNYGFSHKRENIFWLTQFRNKQYISSALNYSAESFLNSPAGAVTLGIKKGPGWTGPDVGRTQTLRMNGVA